MLPSLNLTAVLHARVTTWSFLQMSRHAHFCQPWNLTPCLLLPCTYRHCLPHQQRHLLQRMIRAAHDPEKIDLSGKGNQLDQGCHYNCTAILLLWHPYAVH